ncbi:integrating conjugative element protein [Photorhabdus laumondii subsp. laumondii]|nr:conjugal transfer protein [Photorhabdus laumondii subsp. laumondii]NDL12599.1 integrating conjugative element protein [Photorhabdus kayaii]AXG45182.1 integrating conjugative element protein [Photorhabdus laumondii subsp. laumondii]AXG49769.1 integrating conjugative element protein [Photorhabdus laumondii subsp. laumondii]MCZ1248024.1 integrating conjugative element protein [Photorhabdus laumondii subsp. laumondii]
MMMILTPCSQAALTIVADLGGQSTAAYFDAINAQDNEPTTSSNTEATPPDLTEGGILPVETPELSPGPVDARPLQLPGMGALFMIGDDARSKQWLKENLVGLRKKQAVGLLVSVRDKAQLDELRQLAEGLVLAPASGSDLARRLNLRHYPVLITDIGLTQQVR